MTAERTDRELLELAAKAAGIEVYRGIRHQSEMLFRSVRSVDGRFSGIEWNPLEDDGDALRLAVTLETSPLSPDPTGAKQRPARGSLSPVAWRQSGGRHRTEMTQAPQHDAPLCWSPPIYGSRYRPPVPPWQEVTNE